MITDALCFVLVADTECKPNRSRTVAQDIRSASAASRLGLAAETLTRLAMDGGNALDILVAASRVRAIWQDIEEDTE